MRAVRDALSSARDEGSSSSSGAEGTSTSTTVTTRRAIFSQPSLRRPPWERGGPSLNSPLDLVSQLRGDFEDYTREVYGRNSRSNPLADDNDPESTLDELRERRQNERMQLDSLHARLHGLRLILAMAQLNVAASAEFDTGEVILGENPHEGVVLVSALPPPFFLLFCASPAGLFLTRAARPPSGDRRSQRAPSRAAGRARQAARGDFAKVDGGGG